MINSVLKKITPLILCIMLAGCSTLQKTPPPSETKTPWETRKPTLETIQEWNIKGSVSIQYQGKTDIASMDWQQRNKQYDIALSGPLNFGRITISGAPGSVTFKQGSKSYSASTPETLMQQQLGWQIPISNMTYWVRGLPAPSSINKIIFGNTGYITRLSQQGWDIEFVEYTNMKGVDLPRKIYLNNSTLKIRLVIRTWLI